MRTLLKLILVLALLVTPAFGAGFSNYAEDEVLDHVYGGGDYTRPATLYIALTTATPTDASTCSTITEPASGSYARVSVTNNATNFPASSGGAKANGTAITFTTATASWGTVTHVVICDASSGGNAIAWGALTANKTVDSGDTVSFAIGDLDLTLE